MTIIWNDNLKTGIAIIDEQHQTLFKTINKLSECGSDKSSFLEVLIELQAYVSKHFKTEEEYMIFIDYPGYKNHKIAHDSFVKDYKSVIKKFNSKSGITTLGPDLINLFETWIKEHYSSEDVKMSDFINKAKLSVQ